MFVVRGLSGGGWSGFCMAPKRRFCKPWLVDGVLTAVTFTERPLIHVMVALCRHCLRTARLIKLVTRETAHRALGPSPLVDCTSSSPAFPPKYTYRHLKPSSMSSSAGPHSGKHYQQQWLLHLLRATKPASSAFQPSFETASTSTSPEPNSNAAPASSTARPLSAY